MRNPDAVEQLRAELRQDLQFIEHNARKNREMTQRIERRDTADEYEYAALGYTLHNLYSAFESYFLRIAKFFENNLDETEWHRSLIERMTLTIDGVRPALYDLEYMVAVDELRRFRHLFRNLYKTPLIPRKILFANEFAETAVSEFAGHHEAFDRFLQELKAEL